MLAERGLFVLGLALIGFWLASVWAADRFQAAASRQLEAAMGERGQGGSGGSAGERGTDLAPLARREADSTGIVGKIEIPRLGISKVIGSGVDAKTLSQSVGHVPGTAYPGEPGSVGLAGHRDGVFRRLGEIRAEDLILVTTPDGDFAYLVDSTAVVPPERTDVLRARKDPSVILVTCYPFRWIGPAPNRFVVWAGTRSAKAAARAAARAGAKKPATPAATRR